jgi:hypothetical protein
VYPGRGQDQPGGARLSVNCATLKTARKTARRATRAAIRMVAARSSAPAGKPQYRKAAKQKVSAAVP